MRPDVAVAFDRMAAAARREAGLFLSISSGFRSDAEQAVLWNAKPKPYLILLSRALRGSQAHVGPVDTGDLWRRGPRAHKRARRRRARKLSNGDEVTF
jgi:hypothetical protein